MAEKNTGKTSERAEALARVAIERQTSLSYGITFLIAMERHRGFTTPAEEFLLDMVMAYEVGRLTPRWAQKKLEGFIENDLAAQRTQEQFLRENEIPFTPPARPRHPQAPLSEDNLNLGKLLEDVAALDAHQRKQLRACLTVVSANQGNAFTPIEDAIVEMAHHYQEWRNGFATADGHGLWTYGLDDLRETIDEAETWLKSAIESARHFNSVYPHLLEAKPEGDNAAA